MTRDLVDIICTLYINTCTPVVYCCKWNVMELCVATLEEGGRRRGQSCAVHVMAYTTSFK